MSVSVWEGRTQLSGFVAEAAVASYGLEFDEKARWRGGNGPGWDVAFNDRKVDAKAAFVELVRYKPDGPIPCLGFMGSTRRDVEVRDGVTDYGLVLVHDLINSEVVVDVAQATVSLPHAIRYTLFLIPAEEVNSRFRRPYLVSGDERRRGANLYLPLSEAEAFRVQGPPVDGSGRPVD